MNTLRLLVPEAPPPGAAAPTERRKSAGRSLRLGTLDNSKGNGDHLLAMLVEGLRAALPVASVITLKKPHPSLPADAALLDELAAEADFVVSAMAD
ncbi:MAG: hypothetical protein IT176_11245 [Acidobacteria bacterium]|nr:hypothetical protein [Acidobacteriota bacterium]